MRLRQPDPNARSRGTRRGPAKSQDQGRPADDDRTPPRSGRGRHRTSQRPPNRSHRDSGWGTVFRWRGARKSSGQAVRRRTADPTMWPGAPSGTGRMDAGYPGWYPWHRPTFAGPRGEVVLRPLKMVMRAVVADATPDSYARFRRSSGVRRAAGDRRLSSSASPQPVPGPLAQQHRELTEVPVYERLHAGD